MIPELRVEREKTRREVILAGRDLAVIMAKSPLIQLFAFVALVELAQMVRPDGKNQLISDNWGTAMETLAITQGSLQSLGAAVSEVGPIAMALLAK